jgi:hypothetical protein
MMSVYQRSLELGDAPPAGHPGGDVATVALTVALAVIVPKGFFPQQDTGMIMGVTEAPADVSLPA